jgi:hypothetical protein
MRAGLRVKADQVGAGVGKRRGQRIDRLDHQVHIDRHRRAVRLFGMGLQCLADHRSESQVGHIVVVHDIEMNPVGAGGKDGADLLAQAGEVGREDRGGNAVGGAHRRIVAVTIAS